jgi:signal transduction histidine kinase/DNA-binding response OmpR family regulator
MISRYLIWAGVGLATSFLPASSTGQGGGALPIHMQPDHADWIRKHPVVRYAGLVLSAKEQHRSPRVLPTLGAVYLGWIAERTGLHFERVPVRARDAAHALRDAQRIDLIPEVPLGCGDEPLYRKWRLTVPYYKDAIVIAMRGADHAILDERELFGRTVAIREEGAAETDCMAHWMPGATILRYQTVGEQLRAVVAGDADVAVGPRAVLTPLVHADTGTRLYLSGWFTGSNYTLHMAVRDDDAILAEILNDALRSITAEDAERLYESWIIESGNEGPSWKSIARAYRTEIILIGTALLALLAALAASLRARRIAVDTARARARFAAVVAHEVRTPLNALLATIELLEHEPLHEGHRRSVDRIKATGAALLDLTNRVLDNDIVEMRRVPLTESHCSPIAVSEAALATAIPLAHRKQLTLRFTVDEQVPDFVIVDGARVTQVLVNLLGNAVKYTEQGFVELCVSGRPKGSGVYELRFKVRDSGPGIPAEVQPYLFDPYVRGHPVVGRAKQEGVGLGLAIAKGLVDLMDGAMTVCSRPGEGAVFDVCIPARVAERLLPGQLQGIRVHVDVAGEEMRRTIVRCLTCEGAICEAALASGSTEERHCQLTICDTVGALGLEVRRNCSCCEGALENVEVAPLLPGAVVGACVSVSMHECAGVREQAAMQSSDWLGGTILVADDHALNRLAVSDQLRRLGFDAESACNAQEALARFRESRYAMVLLDCSLGEGDGYECAARMREEEDAMGWARTPIIAYSAHSGQDHVRRCVDAGMDGMLQKPVSLADLSHLLTLWLPSQGDAMPDPGNDRALVLSIDDIFWRTLREDTERLITMRRAADIKGMRRIAHRMFGAAAIANKHEVAYLCRRFIEELQDENAEPREALEDLLRELTGQLNTRFRAIEPGLQ